MKLPRAAGKNGNKITPFMDAIIHSTHHTSYPFLSIHRHSYEQHFCFSIVTSVVFFCFLARCCQHPYKHTHSHIYIHVYTYIYVTEEHLIAFWKFIFNITIIMKNACNHSMAAAAAFHARHILWNSQSKCLCVCVYVCVLHDSVAIYLFCSDGDESGRVNEEVLTAVATAAIDAVMFMKQYKNNDGWMVRHFTLDVRVFASRNHLRSLSCVCMQIKY